METREDIDLETAKLTRDRTKAEIAKLRAETRSLEGPRGFIERNWTQVITAAAALVAGLGGAAALLTAIVQVYQLPYIEPDDLIAAHQKVLDAGRVIKDAQQEQRDADAKAAAARKAEQQARAEQIKLAAEKKATLRELVAAHQTLLQYQTATEKQIDKVQQLTRQLSMSGAAPATGATALQALNAVAGQTGPETKGHAVDIQYADQDSAGAMETVRSSLIRDGYHPSDPELVNENGFGRLRPNEIRYFGGPDMQRAALILAAKVDGYLDAICPPHPQLSAYWHYPDTDAPPTLLELWIKFPCRTPEGAAAR